MSIASDRFEKQVANSINSAIKQLNPDAKADRPKASVKYSDIVMTVPGRPNKKVWCEVKMSHTDNLANPRCFYKNGKWHSTYKTPAAEYAVKMLNDSDDAKEFVLELAQFARISPKDIYIPTTLSGLREPNAVPLKVMKKFFAKKTNQYISEEKKVNLGKLVTEHYTKGKAEPAYYMQAGDDFYLIGNTNPLGLRNIPSLKGTGDFRVRVSTRETYYEIQAEIKIKEMSYSPFSVAPDTKKKNPFSNVR
jgi:hypothetical protein